MIGDGVDVGAMGLIREGTAMTDNRDWRRLFVGRQQELELLRAAWRKVAPEDGPRAEPQFLVLLAESGLGKTRLVQEFYRWLSSTQDPVTDAAPEGYWPDAFASDSESLDVNPRFPEDATGRGRIPWLWWGIRFERPFDRNQIGSRCGLIDYRSGLVSHTGAIAAARGLKQVRKDQRSKGASVAATVAGTVAGLAGLGAAAAMGTLAGLAFAAKDAFSMRGDKAKAAELAGQLERSPGAAQAAEQTDLEDVALDYFRTVLDTGNKEAETVPVVLFLDDAQWADPVTLRFLARLLEEARKQHWPLLVVATHWEVEWKQTLNEPIGDVNRPPRLSAVTETLRQSDEGYSTWLELHTLPPVSDLSGIVRSALPGLSDEQRRVVLDKAGGNPLLLEEILLFLHRRPQFFVSRQLDQPLTEPGLAQVRAEKMNLEKLIDDRFQSLEEEVQRALGWSSEQGLSFLTEITLASAQRVDDSITEERLRTALRRADWPHSLIQTFGDPGQFNRSEFRQAAFHQVAREFLHIQADELDCVQRAIRSTLTAWLLTGRVERLPAEEQLDALLMARRFLSPDASEPEDVRKAWCVGMARLAQNYHDQYLWAQAKELVEEWMRAGSNGWPLLWIDSLKQLAICRVAHLVCNTNLTVQFVENLVEQCKQEVSSNRNIETLRRLTATLSFFAVIQRSCERPMSALEIEQNSTQLREQIVDEFGDHFGTLHDLSISLLRLGDLQRDTGNVIDANITFRKGLAASNRNLSSTGMRIESIRDSMCFHIRLGDLAARTVNPRAAIPHYEQASQLISRATLLYPTEPVLVSDQCSLLMNIGAMHVRLNDHVAAIQQFNAGVALERQLIERGEMLPKGMSELSILLLNSGISHIELNDHTKALAALRESESVCRQRIETFGPSVSARRDLSSVLLQSGRAQRQRGNTSEARRALTECLRLREEILSDAVNSYAAIRQTAIAERELGICECTEGNATDATNYLASGLKRMNDIVVCGGGSPRDDEVRQEIQGILDNIRRRGCPSAADA